MITRLLHLAGKFDKSMPTHGSPKAKFAVLAVTAHIKHGTQECQESVDVMMKLIRGEDEEIKSDRLKAKDASVVRAWGICIGSSGPGLWW